jgi:hypothetical protein
MIFIFIQLKKTDVIDFRALSSLLPIVVAYSDWYLGHWRRSVENLWIMRKVFLFLLFIVVIL